MVEIVLIIFIIGIFTAGKFIAIRKRRVTLSEFKNNTLSKPLYEVVHNLDPVEYGYVIRGKLDYSAYLGQIILMIKRGYLKVSHNKTSIIVYLPTNDKDKLTRIDSLVLLSMKDSMSLRESYESNIEGLRAGVQNTLAKKGWINTKRQPLSKFLDYYFKKYALVLLNILVLINILVIFMGLVLNIDQQILSSIIAMVNITFLSLAYFYTAIEYSKQINTYKDNLTIFASEKYSKQFNDLYGLYLYLKVSGEDTMTPDYEDTLFNQLDELYPYYVSSGLDNHINNLFISIEK